MVAYTAYRHVTLFQLVLRCGKRALDEVFDRAQLGYPPQAGQCLPCILHVLVGALNIGAYIGKGPLHDTFSAFR